ncbi:MAG TPA: hypothetical protein VID48_01235 [Solirubrobacteraceae bacterium]|jgi:hypothetical protein
MLAALVAVFMGAFTFVASAGAEGLSDDGNASWHLEPVLAPELPSGQKSATPIGLGQVGDIEFWAPDRGLLITPGSGNAIPPGLWSYNGVSWHELSDVCGATDGRIAWAGPDEFWSISDGRPGQAIEAEGRTPPLEDNTLCHFSGGQVVGSYASLAFQASSYQPMHGAGCISPSDCWFAGEPLPEPQVGAFQLHWNGSSVTPEPNPQGHAVGDMRPFDGGLYEGVQISPGDLLSTKELEPSVVHLINPDGVQPTFVSIPPEVPLYGPEEFSSAIGFLHLSGDEEALWGVADPVSENELPEGSEPGQVTVVRYAAGNWSQVLGYVEPPGENALASYVVNSIAAEPGSESAWVTLDSPNDAETPSPTAPAIVARVSANGTVSDVLTLPSSEEAAAGVGPKGAASKVVCPAAHDCWMTTTQGWLFHLSTESERHLPLDTDPAFGGLITFRPADEGVPQVVSDTPPADDSGLPEERPPAGAVVTATLPSTNQKIQVPLLSNMHSRLVHGSTLELRFHLAVKARVRLLAKRRKKLVASTPMSTLAAGNRKLLLRLDRNSWPTKLDLQTHALAPLPTVSTAGGGAGSDTIGTSLRVLPHVPPFTGSGLLP